MAHTKVDAELAQAARQHAADAQRADMIARTRRFKSGWHELGEALQACQKDQSFLRWGYSSFEEYYRKELRLKSATVNKLVGSYSYLQRVAPEVLQRDGVSQSIPTAESVEYLRRAAERSALGEVSGEVVDELRTAVLEDGSSLAAVEKRFKPALFPADDKHQVAKQRRDALRTAGQLGGRLEALRGTLPDAVLQAANTAIEQLRAALIAAMDSESPPTAPAAVEVADTGSSSR